MMPLHGCLQGLEDQLLGEVVRQERPDLEEQRDRLVVSIAADKRQLQELEVGRLDRHTLCSGDGCSFLRSAFQDKCPHPGPATLHVAILIRVPLNGESIHL